jgi:hypothetical protein
VRARAPLVLAAIALLLAVISVGATPTPRLVGIRKIQHVVVIMQENRSFDEYFGTFPGADGIPAGVCIPDPAHGGCVKPYHDPSELNLGGPHNAKSAIADINGGNFGFALTAFGCDTAAFVDAIWIEQHPLAGASQFTFEAIFRPDGGAVEQRWFHLAERDPKTSLLASADHPQTGQDANARFLFELRVIDNTTWCLDAFVNGPGYNRAILVREKTHPIGEWYHVADTYDGKMFRSYVNGELQGEAEIAFKPQGPGATSVGVRINKVNYFHGAVAKARFTPKALATSEFMRLPAKK